MTALRVTAMLILLLMLIITTGCSGGGGGEPSAPPTDDTSSTDNGNSGDTGDSTGNQPPAEQPPVVPPSVTPPEPVLAWDAPAYDDGTPVDGVAGYKIYYGTAPGTYTASITTGTTTTYSISQFSSALTASGTYYMAVTAFDTDGMESAFSNEINKDF